MRLLSIRGTAKAGLLPALFLATACSDTAGVPGGQTPLSPSSAIQIQAEHLAPSSPHLADIYDRSCRSCHAYVDAGAPLTGHAEEWDRRMTRGMDTLLANVRNGMGDMPAMGLCFDCTDDDFEALIVFMAEDGNSPAGVE